MSAPTARHLPLPPLALVTGAALATLIAHFPVLHSQARSLDDQQYVHENGLVQDPGWHSAETFLAEIIRPSTVCGYNQPLAMISLMLDTAAGGSPANLAPYRRTNLLLHIANVTLLGWLLYLLFGDALAAGLGAALFGLHPITVEPVAWIAERKGLLAAFFCLWALILYVRFVRRHSMGAYVACIAAFALALLSKPAAVSLPLLIMVLNWWPLRRPLKTALLETLPLMGLAAVSAIITFLGQQQIESAITPGAAPLMQAVLKPLYAVGLYLQKLVWPANMSGYYVAPAPLRLSDPVVLVRLALPLLLVVIALLTCRRTRSVAAGFMFFLLAIAPTLGVVGFTNVVASDKFCYLPMIGFVLLATAGVAAALAHPTWRAGAGRVALVTAVPAVILFTWGAMTRRTLQSWRDTETLFEYQIRTSRCPWQPHAALASFLRRQDRLDESLAHYEEAIRLHPQAWRERKNYALALAQAGRLDAAIGQHDQALRLRPDNVELYYSAAGTLMAAGRVDDAIVYYERALTLAPDYESAHYNLAIALAKAGRNEAAIAAYRHLLQQSPQHWRARCNLALLLIQAGEPAAAVRECEQALAVAPDNADVRTIFAGALAAAGRKADALAQYQTVLKQHPDHKAAQGGLAQLQTAPLRPASQP
jgi:tetratricopeptide (TPR) repeat protein